MSNYEIYSLIVAISVFVIFTVLFGVMVGYMTKTAVKLIRYGDDDKIILKERKYITKTPSKLTKIERAFSALLSLVLVVIFVFSLCISCTDNEFEKGLSNFKIVKSDSMAAKNEKNEYLFENDLNDQFQVFDIVITRPLPKEEDLKLYDIVVYERDGVLVIHRIVGIEEPNQNHSERYFKTQGDAISRHDVYPVLYSQMNAIYTGERIAYVGSFILFIQSPAGWLCFILVMFGILIMPFIEKKLLAAMRKRLAILEAKKDSPTPASVYEPVREEEREWLLTEPDPIPIIPKPAAIPVMAEPEQIPVAITEPVAIPVKREPIAPEPTEIKPLSIPKFDSDYKPAVSRAKLIEERKPLKIELEKRKPIPPTYKTVPLDIEPRPIRPIKISGEFAKNDNVRSHVVPIVLDGETDGERFEIKPIKRYVKLNIN